MSSNCTTFKSLCLESKLTRCHLRSVCHQKPFLLIGMGSILYIFKTDTNGLSELILKKCVFKSVVINKIECFKCCESDSSIDLIISLNANRFLTLFKFSFNYINNRYSSKELLDCYNFYDLILSVKMTENLVFVIKAHNEVDVFDWKTQKMINTISGIDKCILYSAEIISVSDLSTSFVVCSGTVFKEIIVWTAYPKFENSAELTANNLQRLRGHDGVIFALNYNQTLNLLVSASDDRSVRIWTSSFKSKDFCDFVDFWDNNKFIAIHVFYGHLSRIWRVIAITNPFPIVLSVGEDSSLYIWDINEKRLIQKVDGHKNSSIWALGLDIDSMIAFFGGSDSSVISCDIINTITSFNCEVKPDLHPKQIKLIRLQFPHIFCSTISGDLVLMSEQNNRNVFTNSDFNQVFHNYSAIDVNEGRNHILLGSKSGTIASIKIKDNENPFDIRIKNVQKPKVFSICFVDSFTFIVCGIEGRIKMLSLKNLDQICEYVLPNSKHRWSVTGLLYKELLIAGDRCGSLFVYSNQSLNPIKQFNHLHGSNGVTAIKLKPNSQFMYSSGRNGKIFEFLLEDNNCSLLRIFRIFPDMEWIGNFEFDQKTNEISFVYGFQSRNFVIWDERQQRFLESIECGGGHRSWDFAIHKNGFYFCYTKQENVISFHKQMSKIRFDPKLALTQSSHSKKINCCSPLFFSDNLLYFATAGEENVIHINSLDIVTNDWRIETYLFGHISNISAISCTSDEKNSCFMVSVGGRSQLMFWKIQIEDKQLICRQLFSKYLWPSEVIQNRCHKNNNFNSSSDPQIRYLDVSMTRMDLDNYLISTACSDSAVRLFVFNGNRLTLEMVGLNSFNTSCVLKILNTFDCHIMTASNHGFIKIWSISEDILRNNDFNESFVESNQINLKQVLDLRPHECGVNALDIFNFDEYLWLIGSGGDDNTISLYVIEYQNKILNQISSTNEKYIHSCQITGLKIISKNRIMSASIDQRVVLWNYSFDYKVKKLELEPMASYISSIADISSFCISFIPLTNKWKAIVCGEGFQVIDTNVNGMGDQCVPLSSIHFNKLII